MINDGSLSPRKKDLFGEIFVLVMQAIFLGILVESTSEIICSIFFSF